MGQPLTHILTHNRLLHSGFCTTKQHPANPKTTTSRIIFSICFTYQFCFPERNSKGSTDQNQPIPFLVPFVLLVAVCRYSMRSFYGCTIKNRDQAFGLIPKILWVVFHFVKELIQFLSGSLDFCAVLLLQRPVKFHHGSVDGHAGFAGCFFV